MHTRWLAQGNASESAPHLAGWRHVPAMNGGSLEDDIVGRNRYMVAPAGRVAEECMQGRNEGELQGLAAVRRRRTTCAPGRGNLTRAANICMAAPAGLWARRDTDYHISTHLQRVGRGAAATARPVGLAPGAKGWPRRPPWGVSWRAKTKPRGVDAGTHMQHARTTYPAPTLPRTHLTQHLPCSAYLLR